MKSKFSKLFDQLDQLGATDESIADYDERFSEVIGSRVRSYHDTLKYYEMLIGDFNERAQKQLFKFKTFLIGLATLYDHHVDSYGYRTEQWHSEFKQMRQESESIETALEDELARIIDQINMQNQDKSINNLVKKGKVVIEKLQEFEEKETVQVKNMRYIKHWPKLVEYEMSVYKRYLAKFCQNETKEWKIGEMWSFQIDSKHNCDFMDESQNNAMRAFTTLMESRATRRGNQVEVKQTSKNDLKPRDVMRIIVKNYYRKRRPQQMIAWWWRETQQQGYNSSPADGGPTLIPHPDEEQKAEEAADKNKSSEGGDEQDNSDTSNPVYEVIAGSADRSSQLKLGIPAASKFSAMLLQKNKPKMFSKKRFANLIRRNSVQLKVGKGGVDSLIFHLGDRIASNDHVPVFMRDGSIMDSHLHDYSDKIITTYNNHIMEKRFDECQKADKFYAELLDEIKQSSTGKKEKGEGRSASIEEIGERRKEVLQFHRTNFTEHQEEMTNCFNELKDRKDEVLEEQDNVLLLMEEAIEAILPKMTNATNSKQLVEINKEAQAQFDSYKTTMKSTVSEYAKWSYDKGDQIRKSNRTCLKGMKGKMIEASIIKDPLRKIETAVKKTIFMCNKELEYSLPERLRTIEMARITFNDHRLAPHRTDLMYLEGMQRTFTSAQIQLSSETSAISRRLTKLEDEIHKFATLVTNFVARTEMDKFPNLKQLIEIKRKKIEVNTKLCELVNHFNCTNQMYLDPKRDFYALWLSGRCYSMNEDNDDDEIPATLGAPGSNQMAHRKSNARLTRPMRSIANALGGAVMRNRPSKVSISFGMHLQGGNDEKRKSSRIGNLGMTRRKMLDPKMELKQAIFGDPKPPTKEDFPCRLTRFLFQTTDKILAISEQYYKKRGNRPITRPYQIRENFERACDFTMFKIIDFERQAKDFVQKQFMEIRKMVKEFEETCHKIIYLIYQEENREQRMQMPVDIFPVCIYPAEMHYVDLPQVLMVMKRYERLFEALEKANQEHYDQIRTSLGHPECQDELAMLEKKERERQFKTTKAINERDKELRSAITSLSTAQVNAICNLAEKYLTEDDERTSCADLLEVEFNSMDECTIRIKPYFNKPTTWNDFDLGQLPDYQYKAPQTRKNGTIQKEIMKERDHSIRMIEERYLSNLRQFEELKLSSYKDLEFSKKCWDNSIKEIKLLYSNH